MIEVPTQQTIKAAVEAFQPAVEGKLHAWVKVEHESAPALCCVWSERAGQTNMSIVYASGTASIDDVLTFARAINKSMKANKGVIDVLLSLYESHNGRPVGAVVEY